MTEKDVQQALTSSIVKGLLFALGLYLLWGLLHTILEVSLLFALAGIIAIALMPIVNTLERKGVRRGFGAVLVLFALFGLAFGMFELMAPIIRDQVRHLIDHLPVYGERIRNRLNELDPDLAKQLNGQDLGGKAGAIGEALASKVGVFSKSIVGLIVAGLVLITSVAYLLATPRPLLRGMLQAVPKKHRARFMKAFVRGSDMIVRLVWANAVIGVIEATCATAFLTYIHVPGSFVWGAVALFSEMIPQLGAYLMAIPPVLVMLADDPGKALAVLIFYIAMQQAVNHLIAPIIRSRAMKIHPVSEIFMVLSLAMVYGIIGAVIADPVLGFVKGFYDEFYGADQEDRTLDDKVEDMLHRRHDVVEAVQSPKS